MGVEGPANCPEAESGGLPVVTAELEVWARQRDGQRHDASSVPDASGSEPPPRAAARTLVRPQDGLAKFARGTPVRRPSSTSSAIVAALPQWWADQCKDLREDILDVWAAEGSSPRRREVPG